MGSTSQFNPRVQTWKLYHSPFCNHEISKFKSTNEFPRIYHRELDACDSIDDVASRNKNTERIACDQLAWRPQCVAVQRRDVPKVLRAREQHQEHELTLNYANLQLPKTLLEKLRGQFSTFRIAALRAGPRDRHRGYLSSPTDLLVDSQVFVVH